MSKLSDWYLNARVRLERQAYVKEALAHQHAHEQDMRKKRKAQYKDIDKTMQEMRRPDDTPPWEKK